MYLERCLLRPKGLAVTTMDVVFLAYSVNCDKKSIQMLMPNFEYTQ
jgi:hypothetical protein